MNHDLNNLPAGWHWRETPGHGYLTVHSKDNNNVPEFIREREYEEDCDYAIPIVFNKHLFTPEIAAAAEDTFKNWNPEGYEKAFNVKLQKGESHVKDQYFFAVNENVGKYERGASFGDWCYQVPEGYVYAYFRKVLPKKNYSIGYSKGEETTGLITNERYSGSSFFELSEIIQFTRSEDFYTWKDHAAKTGETRYNIFKTLAI